MNLHTFLAIPILMLSGIGLGTVCDLLGLFNQLGG